MFGLRTSQALLAETLAALSTVNVVVVVEVVTVVKIDAFVKVSCASVVDRSRKVEVAVMLFPMSLSDCATVVVVVKSGILLCMQEHADDIIAA
jgi:predicted nucleic acid-binding protein